MIRRKLLHRMMKEVCGATSLDDEGQIDSGRKSSGRNLAFNLYLYVDVCNSSL